MCTSGHPLIPPSPGSFEYWWTRTPAIVRRVASHWQATEGRAASAHDTQNGGGGSRPHTPRSLAPVPPASEDAWSSESDGSVTTDNIQVGH